MEQFFPANFSHGLSKEKPLQFEYIDYILQFLIISPWALTTRYQLKSSTLKKKYLLYFLTNIAMCPMEFYNNFYAISQFHKNLRAKV